MPPPSMSWRRGSSKRKRRREKAMGDVGGAGYRWWCYC
jgi:hypothetical protein